MMTNPYEALLADVTLPRMVRIKQTFKRPMVDDVKLELQRKLHQSDHMKSITKGMKVAIAVGSRGIAHLSQLVTELVSQVKQRDAYPFIVPAMGSHGGANAEGQREILANFGITETSIGAPIHSSMDTVVLGHTANGLTVYYDAFASQADATIIVAKIKPHPGFHGTYESGLAKMVVIGLGKQIGAEACHAAGMDQMAERVEEIASRSLELNNVVFAVGVLENAYDDIAKIVTVSSDSIMKEEPALLEEARALMGSIPFKSIDVLIVDEIGKDISGPGMDCNVIRRYTAEHLRTEGLAQRIVIRDLTEETGGNATGVGNGDVITRRLFQKIKFEKTYPNQLTSRVVISGKIPIIMENDDLAIKAAIKTTVNRPLDQIRIVRIKNTLHIETMDISENLMCEIAERNDIKIISDLFQYHFDEQGNLMDSFESDSR